jgi:stress response protein YsnF
MSFDFEEVPGGTARASSEAVLRERVIIRKETVTDWQTVEAELRREHVSFDTDDLPAGSVEETVHASSVPMVAAGAPCASRR